MVALGLGGLAVPGAARAAEDDKLNERVSAAACQPRLASDRSKLTWNGVDWRFTTGETGEVFLECPVYTPWTDEDSGNRIIEELRMWYIDTSGDLTDASVKVELRRIAPPSLTSVLVGTVLSDNNSNTSPTTFATALNNLAMVDAQYFLVVRLFRQGTNRTVTFRGVSFFEAP
ncbi:hypothetical protein [Nannocystis bainbridge]|uniref:hypothetical protein n=1 Tax=Nannocystis bainbridge TaxID=2995303 RepID=UPI00232FBD1F|nr:hypothetical protein [Nannocystis bainbridge]